MEIQYSAIEWSVIVAWLVGRAALIMLIFVLCWVLRSATKRLIPPLIKATVVKRTPLADAGEAAKRYHTVSSVAVKTIHVVLWIVFAFMSLALLGVDISPVLAAVGVAGLAIGFGSQSLVKDVIAGLFILLENQYGKGDVVKLAGISGLVEDVNLRRTVLRDQDGTVHTIPNGEVRIASNLTRDWSRVNLAITVGYGESLDRAIAIINAVAADLSNDAALAEAIVEAPKAVRVESFDEPGVAIRVLGVTKPGKQWLVAGELRKRLKEAFEAEGVVFAYARKEPVSPPALQSN